MTTIGWALAPLTSAITIQQVLNFTAFGFQPGLAQIPLLLVGPLEVALESCGINYPTLPPDTMLFESFSNRGCQKLSPVFLL